MEFFTPTVLTRNIAFTVLILMLGWSLALNVAADEIPIAQSVTIAGAGLDLFDDAAAADINGDRAKDALYSFRDRTTGDYGIAWNESDFPGSNGPDPLTRWIVAEGSSDSWDALAAADFDEDGDLDVAAVEEDRIVLFANETGAGRTGDWEDFTVSTALQESRGILAAADIDNDGDPDLFGNIASGVFFSRFGWIENLGRDDSGVFPVWTFAEHAIEAIVEAQISIVRAADMDGDGDVDVVARVELPVTPPLTEFKVVWYENRVRSGAPWLRHDIVPDSATAQDIMAIAIGDINADGDLDVVFARDLNQDLVWHENQGDGASWSGAIIISETTLVNEFRFALATGDVDQDGDTDVVQGASGSFGSHRVVWHDNEAADGTAWTEYSLTEDGYGTNAIAVDDLDDDGDTDVLISYPGDESNSPRVAWFENLTIHRRAAYHERLVASAAANGAIFVVAADIDRDGDQDMVGVGDGDVRVEWYENDGTPAGQGDWTPRFVANAPQYPKAVSAADIDRDGDTDLVVVTSDPGFLGGPGDLIWYENADGAGGSWVSHTIDTTLSFASSVKWADIDNDGDADIVTAIGSALLFNPGRVWWFENTAGDGSVWLRQQVGTVTNSRPNVSVGDIDHDGDTDITVATYNDGNVSWFENENTGWVLHSITNEADGARSTFVADLDGDGDNDVLSASAQDNSIAWYANTDGDGGFGARQVIDNAVQSASFVFAADLDGDADQDVLAASPNGDRIVWFDNSGAGAFGVAQSVTTASNGAFGVFVADINGDGVMDVLSASQDDDTVAWHPNVGGQLSLPSDDTAPTTLAGGQKDDVLRIVARHNGRTGDPDLKVESLHVRFRSATGGTLSAAQFSALANSVQIYADIDDSGDWVAPPDLPFNTVGPIFFPTGPADGYVTFVGGLTLSAGQERTLFMVLGFKPNAHLQTPNALRAVHVTSSSSTGSYTDYDLAVTIEAAPDVVSSVVTAVAPDSDDDGIADEDDNCTTVANAPQRDTDGDGIGNRCDADIRVPNDCVVNSLDLGTIKVAFFSSPGQPNWNPDADFNGDDAVNVVDLAVMKSQFFAPPGPSGVPNICDVEQN
jgi:hypothetical protein